MINEVILRGRLCHDPILRHTNSGTAVCEYTIAVNRGYGEEQQTDFINCVAWGKVAEFLVSYFNQGKMIEVEGRLKSEMWKDKEGNAKYALKVTTARVDFGESKKGNA